MNVGASRPPGHVVDQSIGPTGLHEGKNKANLNKQKQLEHKKKKAAPEQEYRAELTTSSTQKIRGMMYEITNNHNDMLCVLHFLLA